MSGILSLKDHACITVVTTKTIDCPHECNVTIRYAGLIVSLYLGVVEIVTIEYSYHNTVHVSINHIIPVS